MSKPKTDAKRKGGKRRRRKLRRPRKPSRGDRYRMTASYCAKVEKLGADGLAPLRSAASSASPFDVEALDREVPGVRRGRRRSR